MSEQPVINALQSFELLASAIAGRTLNLADAAEEQPTWTDGRTIFVDSSLDEDDKRMAIIIQAALVAAGSLSPQIMRRLLRNPAATKRYLFLEANRALVSIEAFLPCSIQEICNGQDRPVSGSAACSLEMAFNRREAIPEPPIYYGAVLPKRLLAMNAAAATPAVASDQQHIPRQQRNQKLVEFEDGVDEDDNASSAAVDMFSVPGGAGFLGRWLQRLFSAVRQGNASGSPGIDAPTHRSRSMTPRGGKFVLSTANVDLLDEATEQNPGLKYPEWDLQRRHYRSDWCSVQEVEPPQKEIAQPALPDSAGLHKPLARIGLGFDRRRRQSQGDDIDIDAAIAARIEMTFGSSPDESVYINNVRRKRDLSVLILLDISGSAAEPGAHGQTVHEQQRAVAASLTSVLHHLGDRVALYAFNSQGRSSVQLVPVKRFDDIFGVFTMQRLHRLAPNAFSRLGAAIRHGAAVLEEQGGTTRRLLLVLSDGLAYDHGYERDYGAADARRALAEAQQRGTGSLCLTIGASTDAESLRRVFGSAAHATISKPSQLGEVIGSLFKSALRSAEVRRRVS